MPHQLSIQVLNWKGEPEEGVLVQVSIDGWFGGGDLESSITDDDGHAFFETADDYEASRKVNISARGQYFGPFEIGGGAYTINV